MTTFRGAVYFEISVTYLDRAVAQGGEVLHPRTSICELGFVAEFRDSEGNRIALHEPTHQ